MLTRRARVKGNIFTVALTMWGGVQQLAGDDRLYGQEEERPGKDEKGEWREEKHMSLYQQMRRVSPLPTWPRGATCFTKKRIAVAAAKHPRPFLQQWPDETPSGSQARDPSPKENRLFSSSSPLAHEPDPGSPQPFSGPCLPLSAREHEASPGQPDTQLFSGGPRQNSH